MKSDKMYSHICILCIVFGEFEICRIGVCICIRYSTHICICATVVMTKHSSMDNKLETIEGNYVVILEH